MNGAINRLLFICLIHPFLNQHALNIPNQNSLAILKRMLTTLQQSNYSFLGIGNLFDK